MDWVSGIFGVGDMNEYEIDPLCKWLLERIFSSEEKIISHLELNFHNRLSCDLSLLAFAIFQILMNGKESMKGGGDIYIKTFGDHGNYNLIITDTGEGFSPEIRKKLFTGPVSTKPGCMGYGLYFVKMILGALNGNIHFRSHLNRGTEVSVIIPLIS